MSSEDLVIRNYRQSDDQRILEITKAAWVDMTITKRIEDEFGQCAGKPWWLWKVEPLLEFGKSNPERFYTAQYDGQIVGYAMYSLDQGTKIGRVLDNAVDPAFGGRGIGSALHKKVLQDMKEAGMKLAMVSTGDHQIPARKMYEKHGFKALFQTVHYFNKLSDLEEMMR